MRTERPYISIVINCDTRPKRDSVNQMFQGVVNDDFLVDGVLNKKKFFEGFDHEVILFIDEHRTIENRTYQKLRTICDTLVIRKHTSEPNFNDYNFIEALSLARGEYVAHFDQDCALFTSSKGAVERYIKHLDNFDYVSYQSQWTPNPVHDDSFDHWWVSTRFFICKRETLNFTEIRKCQENYDYCFSKYPAKRKCHWTEHILGLIARDRCGVYYPPFNDECVVFSWGKYRDGVLSKMNNMTYEEVIEFINKNGGIHYPNDLTLL